MGGPSLSSLGRNCYTISGRMSLFPYVSCVFCLFWTFILSSSTPTAMALIHGVDSYQEVPTLSFTTAKGQGFSKAIIRGYHEACSEGGEVEPNFLTSYKNAVSAGYTDIDTYWFPCTSSSYPCKSYSTQLSELGAVFKANNMQIGRIWIDIENSDACTKEWDYGYSGNIDQAKALISTAKDSGYVLGIYSSSGEWSTVFGSYTVDIASDLPLWNAQFDGDDTSLTMSRTYGGWTTAFGKQYTDKSASGLFDLNIFSS